MVYKVEGNGWVKGGIIYKVKGNIYIYKVKGDIYKVKGSRWL